MDFYTSEYKKLNNIIFDNFTKLYNKKYLSSIVFSGIIKASYNSDNTYYVKCNLIVKNNSGNVIFNASKDFTIIDNNTKIFFNQYELINLYQYIKELTEITPKMYC